MTTKPPSAVAPAAQDSNEKIAYESVNGVETIEPNDRNRLGYHIWRWMTGAGGTLEDAVRESGARLKVPQEVAVRIIREALSSRGIRIG